MAEDELAWLVDFEVGLPKALAEGGQLKRSAPAAGLDDVGAVEKAMRSVDTPLNSTSWAPLMRELLAKRMKNQCRSITIHSLCSGMATERYALQDSLLQAFRTQLPGASTDKIDTASC